VLACNVSHFREFRHSVVNNQYFCDSQPFPSSGELDDVAIFWVKLKFLKHVTHKHQIGLVIHTWIHLRLLLQVTGLFKPSILWIAIFCYCSKMTAIRELIVILVSYK